MPLLNGGAGFVVAAEFDAGAETGVAAFAIEAAAKLLGQGQEARRGDGREIASGELGIEPAQVIRERLEALLFGSERLVHELLPLDGAEVLDEVLVLAAPEDEGAFGDAELFGDAAEAEAAGTQFNEPLNGILIFHNKPYVAGRKSRLTGTAPAFSREHRVREDRST